MPYFLAQELIPGYLNGIEATYTPPKGYFIAKEKPEDFAKYEAEFPYKEKLISVAKGNGFETLKVCLEILSSSIPTLSTPGAF